MARDFLPFGYFEDTKNSLEYEDLKDEDVKNDDKDKEDPNYAEYWKDCDDIVEHGPFTCPEKYNFASCEYSIFENKCTRQELCFAKFTNDKYEQEGLCEEFNIESRPKCEIACSKAYSCPDSPFEWCEMIECQDRCSHEITCYAEWTNFQREF